MAYTTIDDPSAHFQTLLYTGNGSARSLTNDGNSDLQADWIWIKERNNAVDHQLQDSSRGVTKTLQSNSNNGESTLSDIVTAFNSDGFSLGNNASWNENGDTYVAWQWKANGGTTTSGGGNDSVSTSTHQANTTSGFSVVTYTGNGTAGATVAHGLGAVPQVVLLKRRDADGDTWQMYHHSLGNTHYLQLNNTDASTDGEVFNDTTPSSSVFTLHDFGASNGNNSTFVAYCFTPIQGYSKFDSYTGNGNADGTFVYTGFKPAWIMVKKTNEAEAWFIADSKRTPINPNDDIIEANDQAAEGNSTTLDLLSNGFKFRHENGNTTGDSYLYMAFAESPFVSSEGVPTTAR